MSDLLTVETIYKTMLTFCLKCSNVTECKNPRVEKHLQEN